MRAILCRDFGPPERLVLADLPSPVPGPGEVVVRVRAAGVNFPDTLIIEDKYQYKPALPFVPGGEAAGEVLSAGPGVSRVSPGDRVIAVSPWGAFAEEMTVAEADLFPLPAGLDDVRAAALALAYGTAHYALTDRAGLRPGESLLVLGAGGGTGLAAVAIGKLLGARVIAAAGSAEKLALARAQGADETIDYRAEDMRAAAKALGGETGIDVIYDPVGGDLSEQAFRAIAWGGRHLVIGFASGAVPRLPLNLPLLKGAAAVGVFWGAFREREQAAARAGIETVGRWASEGRLAIHVSRTHSLAEAARALSDLAGRRALGKIVLTMDD